MQDSAQDYKKTLTGIIQSQIAILGPAITLSKVRHVRGLSVSDDGTVTSISETPESITKELVRQFTELSPFITKKTMAPLLYQIQSPIQAPPTERTHQEEEHLMHNT